MSPLTFTVKQRPAQRVDMAPLVSQKLTGLSLAQIQEIELQSGNRKLAVGELFDVTGSDVQHIVIDGSHDKLDYIGRESESGHIEVRGDAGAYLAQGMKSGTVSVSGNAGIYAACELKNGLVRIDGDCGDFLGAALPGNKQGMKGGTVLIKGNAGARAGDHMRRGAILIEGDAGEYCGARMLAGTIAVMGQTGRYPGYAMRRGTLLLWRQPQLAASFNDCGAHTLSFLPLLFASFGTLESRFAEPGAAFKRVQRYAGDLAESGKGEILVKIAATD